MPVSSVEAHQFLNDTLALHDQGMNAVGQSVGKGVTGTEARPPLQSPELEQQKQPPALPQSKAAFSVEDMTLILMGLKTKMGEEQQSMSVTDIKKTMTEQQSKAQERVKKIEESIEKMDKAKKGGVFGKIFGWVATIATVVAAAAMIATGVGAVVGGLLIAGAVVSLANQIAQEIPAVREWMAKHPAFGWAMLAVQVALSIATVTAALKTAATTAVQAGVEAAKETAKVTAKQVARIVANISAMVEAGATAGSGAAGIATSAYNKQASNAQVDAKKIEAELLEAQAAIDDEMRRLRKMLEEAKEGFSIAMNIMNTATQSKQTIAKEMLRQSMA